MKNCIYLSILLLCVCSVSLAERNDRDQKDRRNKSPRYQFNLVVPGQPYYHPAPYGPPMMPLVPYYGPRPYYHMPYYNPYYYHNSPRFEFRYVK